MTYRQDTIDQIPRAPNKWYTSVSVLAPEKEKHFRCRLLFHLITQNWICIENSNIRHLSEKGEFFSFYSFLASVNEQ